VIIIRNLQVKLSGLKAGFLNVSECGVYTDTTGLVRVQQVCPQLFQSNSYVVRWNTLKPFTSWSFLFYWL